MPRKRKFMRKNNTKLNNQAVVIDGIEFQSKKEGKRYSELKLLERAGEISNLELQKRYELIPAQYEIVETGEYYKVGDKKGQAKTKRVCIEQSIALAPVKIHTLAGSCTCSSLGTFLKFFKKGERFSFVCGIM